MKTVLKSFVVVLIVFCMALSPAFLGLARAGGLHYEGYSGYKPNSSWGYEDGQTRGLMFNFSFGGPKDYKQDSPWQEIYRKSLTQNEKTAVFVLGAVGVFVTIMLMTDEDDNNKNDECKGYIGSTPGFFNYETTKCFN